MLFERVIYNTMQFEKILLTILVVITVSGCLELKDDDKINQYKCSDGRLVLKPIECIEGRTTTKPSTTLFTSTSTTTMPLSFPKETTTSTRKRIVRPATTTLIDPCANNILDPGEDIVDCGSNCYCRVLNLTPWGSVKKHEPSSYSFGVNGTVLVPGGECGRGEWPLHASYFHYECKKLRYILNVTTMESLLDVRAVNLGNSYFIDNLEFGLLDDDPDNFIIAVRKDQYTENISDRYKIMSLGGVSCGYNGMGLCTREYKNYTITLLERSVEGIKVEVRNPEGNILPKEWVYNKPVFFGGLEMGVVRPLTLGGYSTVYVHAK